MHILIGYNLAKKKKKKTDIGETHHSRELLYKFTFFQVPLGLHVLLMHHHQLLCILLQLLLHFTLMVMH